MVKWERRGSFRQPPFLLLDARSEWAWARVGGITPAARLLYHSTHAGVTRIVVILRRGITNHEQYLREWIGTASLRIEIASSPHLDPFLQQFSANGDVLFMNAAFIIDPRLVTALITARSTTILRSDKEGRYASDNRTVAMLVKACDVPAWRQNGLESAVPGSSQLFPDDIDPYVPHLRGRLHPYVMKVEDMASARRATWTLIRSQQKKVMDLPSMYLDPFFENWLTRLLCSTPVTPNMVTFLGAAIAILAALCFWHGFFITGALIMFLVEILDGVDGKLARTKLMFTRVGEYEDIIDYAYENFCYIALAVGLTRTVASPAHLPAILAGILIASDTVDNILYTLSGRWYGKSLDLMHRFDAGFRLIAGRRNIYGLMFVVGFSLGYPLVTFALAAAWSLVTAFVHGVRLLQHAVATRSAFKEGYKTLVEEAKPQAGGPQ
jgi:phosphatidylglycerophosphate synthase